VEHASEPGADGAAAEGLSAVRARDASEADDDEEDRYQGDGAQDGSRTADSADAPRWGRQSTGAAAQQAIRQRGSRPRWLPRWLPFVILLLAGAALMASNPAGRPEWL
jgi:hypothetical protein